MGIFKKCYDGTSGVAMTGFLLTMLGFFGGGLAGEKIYPDEDIGSKGAAVSDVATQAYTAEIKGLAENETRILSLNAAFQNNDLAEVLKITEPSAREKIDDAIKKNAADKDAVQKNIMDLSMRLALDATLDEQDAESLWVSLDKQTVTPLPDKLDFASGMLKECRFEEKTPEGITACTRDKRAAYLLSSIGIGGGLGLTTFLSLPFWAAARRRKRDERDHKRWEEVTKYDDEMQRRWEAQWLQKPAVKEKPKVPHKLRLD